MIGKPPLPLKPLAHMPVKPPLECLNELVRYLLSNTVYRNPGIQNDLPYVFYGVLCNNFKNLHTENCNVNYPT